MALKFFNTRSRTVEAFAALDPEGKKVGLYCCGPTVHDLAHIGNFRTFVFADLVRRWLEFKGFSVRHVMNITDVEDKIIKRVHESGLPLPQYTSRYETEFFSDFQTLGCLRPHETPRATAHIADIISLIDKLMARGIAYRAGDGSIYFSIEKYQAAGHRYGQLLNLNFDEMRRGERVSSDEYEKEAIADFALWKARVPGDGAVFWPAPWGEGRPGWHIECSAMSAKLLGATFDIHMGGEDLIFPHHEDEIAQSEGAGLQSPGQPFVNYWLHGAHLLVEGRKMSKSLGNYFTVRDLLSKGFSGREIRYLLLTAHYREAFNFTIEGLRSGRAALQRLDECLGKLRDLAGTLSAPTDQSVINDFSAALDEDFNVSRGWAVVFEQVKEANRALVEKRMTAALAAGTLGALDRVLSIIGLPPAAEADAPAEMLALLEERQTARKAKDFKRADAMRDELKAKGWMIEDTPKGPRLKKG